MMNAALRCAIVFAAHRSSPTIAFLLPRHIFATTTAEMPPSNKRPANKRQSNLLGFFQSSSKRVKTTVASNCESATRTANNDKSAQEASRKSTHEYTIFCDLDGVLVDFDAGVKKLTGKSPHQLQARHMWSRVNKAAMFYRNLPWKHDGEQLWETLRTCGLPVNILSGIPMSACASRDKYEWCKRELCVETVHVDRAGPKKSHAGNGRKQEDKVNVITCWSRNKHCESKPGHVLIDDRQSLQKEWERAGGIFILHTDTQSTLQQLREIGILNAISDEKLASDVHETPNTDTDASEKSPGSG